MSDSLVIDIENDIIFGLHPPGVRIIEDHAMEYYGAKRHAVRNAFAELEDRGLLVRRPNCGVEVADYTPDEVDTLYDLRIILETAAALRTRLPCDGDSLDRLEKIARLHEDAVKTQDYRSVFRLNQEFHEVQYSFCENPRLAALIEKYARAAQPIRVVKYEDIAHMKQIVEQHLNIIAALRETSHDDLVAAVKAHLPASAEAYRSMYNRRYAARAHSS